MPLQPSKPEYARGERNNGVVVGSKRQVFYLYVSENASGVRRQCWIMFGKFARCLPNLSITKTLLVFLAEKCEWVDSIHRRKYLIV